LNEIFYEPDKYSLFSKNEFKIDSFTCNDLTYVKTNLQSDILWVLWIGLLNYVKKYIKENDYHFYLLALFKLSQLGFQKKNRKSRLTFLLVAVNCIQKLNCDFSYAEEKDLIYEKVLSQIQVLFEDYITKTTNSCKTSKGYKKKINKDLAENEEMLSITSDSTSSSSSDESEYSRCSSSTVLSVSSFKQRKKMSQSTRQKTAKGEEFILYESDHFDQKRDPKKKDSKHTNKRKKLKNNKSKVDSRSSSESDFPDYLNIITYKQHI